MHARYVYTPAICIRVYIEKIGTNIISDLVQCEKKTLPVAHNVLPQMFLTRSQRGGYFFFGEVIIFVFAACRDLIEYPKHCKPGYLAAQLSVSRRYAIYQIVQQGLYLIMNN